MGSFASGAFRSAAEGFLRSAPIRESVESILSKFSTSAPFAEMLKNEYEPAVARGSQYFKGQGMSMWAARNSSRRIEDVVHFGSNYQNIANMINQTRANHGTIAAQQVADAVSVYLKEGGLGGGAPGKEWRRVAKVGYSPYTEPGFVENKLKSAARYLFTSRIALPHMSQPLNTILIAGFNNSVKALNDIIKDPQLMLQRALRAGAFEYEHVDQFGQILNRNSWYDKVFNQPGFAFLRKWQIVHAAISGEYAARDAADRILFHPQGSTEFKTAASELKLFGVDANEVLQSRGLTPDHINTARFKGADEAMFINRNLRTPPAWEHNYGMRFAMMYRHYMFTQSKFLKDSLKRSFALAREGNPVPFIKTVAIIGSLFPAAGELIKMASGLATGHDPTSPEFRANRVKPLENIAGAVGVSAAGLDMADEYIDALSHVAGFGIMYSMMRSAKRNALAEFFIGPYGTTLADLGQDLYHMKGEELGRDIVSRVPTVGSAASRYIFPPRKKGRGSSGPAY